MRLIVIDDFPPTDFICPSTDENGNTKIFSTMNDALKEAEEIQNGKIFDLNDPLNGTQKEKVFTKVSYIKALLNVSDVLSPNVKNSIKDALDFILAEVDYKH